jgi:hypothetical protein
MHPSKQQEDGWHRIFPEFFPAQRNFSREMALKRSETPGTA